MRMENKIKNRLYIIDFETGGLNVYMNPPVSFCMKKYREDFSIYNEFKARGGIYSMSALEVNQYSIEELQERGLSTNTVIDTIEDLYNHHQDYIVLAGYNIDEFDVKILNQIYREKKMNFPCPILTLDVLEVAKKNIKKRDKRKKEDSGVEDYSLESVYNFIFEDDVEQAHSADADVRMTEELLKEFEEREWL